MTETQTIFDLDPTNFEEIVLKGSLNVPVVVDFWAPWCEPCKSLAPILEKLAQEFEGRFILAKLNTEDHQSLAAQFGIRSIPTVKLIKDGKIIDEFSGALPEQEVRAFLEKHCAAEVNALLGQVKQLAREGQVEVAIRLIEENEDDANPNPDLMIVHAKLLATTGDIEKAEAKLDALPEDDQKSVDAKALRARFFFDRIAADAPPPAELMKQLEEQPDDSEKGYQLAAHGVMDNQFAPALEQLITIMQRDREYLDDGARKAMVLIFDIIGADNPLTGRYRNRILNILH